MIKLNLGCAKTILSDYVNIDLYQYDPRIVVGDIRNLNNYENESVDEILAQDVIEHIPFQQAKDAIKEWARILKSGGKLTVQTTNINKHIECFTKNIWDLQTLNDMLFAGKNWVDGSTREGDFHKSIYSVNYLNSLFEENKIQVTSIQETDIHHPGNMNLTITGFKK